MSQITRPENKLVGFCAASRRYGSLRIIRGWFRRSWGTTIDVSERLAGRGAAIEREEW